MAPEPTVEMVEAAMERMGNGSTTPIARSYAKRIVCAAFAAAPPEWLLRAALTEDQLTVLSCRWFKSKEILELQELASRALRGGEEPDNRWMPDGTRVGGE